MKDINEYVELWADCLGWMDSPDAGDRIGVLLAEVYDHDGADGLCLFAGAAILCGVPEELLGHPDAVYKLETFVDDWQGFPNLLLNVGQFMIAVVREDFEMAWAIFLAQLDPDEEPCERTAAFMALALHVAKERPYLGVIIGRP